MSERAAATDAALTVQQAHALDRRKHAGTRGARARRHEQALRGQMQIARLLERNRLVHGANAYTLC